MQANAAEEGQTPEVCRAPVSNPLPAHRGGSPEPHLAPPLVAALFIAVFLANIPRTVVSTVMDPSWGAVLTYAHQHGLQFGRDIVFPYGPLGFAFIFDFAGHFVNLRLIVDFLFCYTVAAGACLVAWRMSLGWRWVFLGFLVLSPANILPSQDLPLETGPLYWGLLCLFGSNSRTRTCEIVLGLLVGMLGLVKFTSLVVGGVTLLAVSLVRAWQGNSRGAALIFGCAAGSFLVGWLALGQSLFGLWSYALNSLSLTSGFNLAMAQSAARDIRVAGVLAIVLTLLAIGARCLTASLNGSGRPTVHRGVLLVWLCFVTFLSWKHGFVRADGHVAIFFGVATLLTLSLEAIPSSAPWARMLGYGAAIALCLLTCTSMDWMFPGAMEQRPDRALRRFSNNLRTLLRPSTYKSEMGRKLKHESERSQLPVIRAAVGEATVDVFGQNQAYAIFNALNYHPRPVFQSYSAYTPRLAGLNEQFYSGPAAPDYVIFSLAPLDERFPALEDSGTLKTLLTRYRPVDGEAIFLLLKRTNAAVPALTALAQGTARVGEPIRLPGAEVGDLWLQVSLRPTLLGRLERFLYQPPGVRLGIWHGPEPTRGEAYPAPTSMLEAGFIVSPLLLNNFDVVDLYAGVSNARPTAVSIEIPPHDRKSFREPFSYRIQRFSSRLGGTPDVAVSHLRWPGFKSYPVDTRSPERPLRLTIVEGKPAVFIHPWGYLAFVCPPGATMVTGAYGFEESAYTTGTTDGAEFRVELHSEDGSKQLLHSALLEPKTRPQDRGLHPFKIQLPNEAHGKIFLSVLPGPKNDTAWDLACWAQIEIK